MIVVSGIAFGQEERWLEVARAQRTSFFGRSACTTIDLDGDGVRDIAAGAEFGGEDRRGAIVFLSGMDLSVLRVVNAPDNRSGFGHEVRGSCGDLDADGAEDLVVGSRWGQVLAYSPRLSKVITRFGDGSHYCGPVGDVDGDGCDDVALRGGNWAKGGCWEPNDCIASGMTGEPLLRFDFSRDSFAAYRSDLLGPIQNSIVESVGPLALTLRRSRAKGLTFVGLHSAEIGHAGGPGPQNPPISLGDIDGDGHLDLIRPWSDSGGADAHVRLYESREGTTRAVRNLTDSGAPFESSFAYSAIALPDIDGDGRCEIAISDPQYFVGHIIVYSSATSKPIWQYDGSGCGVTLELIQDRDQDGTPDLLVGGGEWEYVDPFFAGDGYLRILSTRTGKELASVEEAAIDPVLGMPVKAR